MTIRSIKTYYWDRGKPSQRRGVVIRNQHGFLFIEPEDVIEVANRLVDWLEAEESHRQRGGTNERETR